MNYVNITKARDFAYSEDGITWDITYFYAYISIMRQLKDNVEAVIDDQLGIEQ